MQLATPPTYSCTCTCLSDFYNENYFAGAAYGGASEASVRYINATAAEDTAWAEVPAATGGGVVSGVASEPGWGYVPGYYRVPCNGGGTDGSNSNSNSNSNNNSNSNSNSTGTGTPCWFFLPGKPQPTDGAFADRGLVVRWWDAVLGGKRVTMPHFSLYRTTRS